MFDCTHAVSSSHAANESVGFTLNTHSDHNALAGALMQVLLRAQDKLKTGNLWRAAVMQLDLHKAKASQS